MEKFVHTQDFKALNIGFALDEGMACPTDEFIIFNGERSIWRKHYEDIEKLIPWIQNHDKLLTLFFSEIHVHCTGQPGHGSLLIPNTAGEKVGTYY